MRMRNVMHEHVKDIRLGWCGVPGKVRETRYGMNGSHALRVYAIYLHTEFVC